MSQAPQFTIVPAESAADLSAVADLFSTYVAWLNIDLTYQGFAEELRSLPGNYSPAAGGALLIAKSSSGEVLGCVGLRRLSLKSAEVKRLYVSENGRGLGLGKGLVDGIMEAGRELGYEELKLDTLPSMEAALKMYKRHGFEEIPAYYDTPVESTIFLCKRF